MIVRVDDIKSGMNAQGQTFEWDETWRIVMLIDSEYQSMCGKGERGAYTIKMSRQNCNWQLKIGDLISYANAENLNVILFISAAELQEVTQSYQGHSYDDHELRLDEPKILIHSTPLENWEQIRRDGHLKSWNRAKKESNLKENQPIGHVLGDPEDFKDYIMFGSGVNCEIVVASKQAGRLVDDADAVYQSGARLYFDARRIAKDGLLVRDGNHLKVKDQMELQPYLLWAATWESLHLSARETTPERFAAIADQMFLHTHQQTEKME